MNNKKCNKFGFTLMELMAVVAVVAILSALALGSYRKAIVRATFAEALQNAHAYASATDQYFYEEHTWPASLSAVNMDLTTSTKSEITYTLHTAEDPYIQAQQQDGIFTLRVFMEANGPTTSGGQLKQDTCSPAEFCATVGFVNCAEGTCTKF